MVIVAEGTFPSFAKEGWTRPKEIAAKLPLIGADGVVVSSCRLSNPIGCDNRWLETTTPSAPEKERGHFSLWRSHPSFAKEGTGLGRIVFRNFELPAQVEALFFSIQPLAESRGA